MREKQSISVFLPLGCGVRFSGMVAYISGYSSEYACSFSMKSQMSSSVSLVTVLISNAKFFMPRLVSLTNSS